MDPALGSGPILEVVIEPDAKLTHRVLGERRAEEARTRRALSLVLSASHATSSSGVRQNRQLNAGGSSLVNHAS